eukprot:scaffold4640_cov149-Skeletonema_menzelii.AAC.4
MSFCSHDRRPRPKKASCISSFDAACSLFVTGFVFVWAVVLLSLESLLHGASHSKAMVAIIAIKKLTLNEEEEA